MSWIILCCFFLGLLPEIGTRGVGGQIGLSTDPQEEGRKHSHQKQKQSIRPCVGRGRERRERTIEVKVKPRGEGSRGRGKRRVSFYLNKGRRRERGEREETAAFD